MMEICRQMENDFFSEEENEWINMKEISENQTEEKIAQEMKKSVVVAHFSL